MLPIAYIEARDIPDAWFQCVSKVQDIGFKYIIQQGSNVGQTRMEFDWITIQIAHPYAEPYDLMLPDIPVHLNIPNPVALGYVEQYLPYLMTGEKKPNEDYTYGQRLVKADSYDHDAILQYEHLIEKSMETNKPIPLGLCLPHMHWWISQVDWFIKLLKETPNTNQAILQVGQPSDCELNDPPCLRHIDMRGKEGELIFYPYFRSWDLWGGFPANLAAIAVLQKYMADEIGIERGPIIASSKGLHLYGYVEELARLRCNKK